MMPKTATRLVILTTLALGPFGYGCAAADREAQLAEPEPLGPTGYVADRSAATFEPIDPARVDPSVVAATRDNWRSRRAGPLRPRVPHPPNYFEEEGFGITWRATPDRPTPLHHDGVIEHQADFATAVGREQRVSRDAADFALGAGKYAVDMIKLPLELVMRPPWTTEHTPPID